MITWWGMASAAMLLVVAAGLSALFQVGVERSILWAGARMAVQLALVGGLLTLVLAPGRSIWWSWLWVAGMVGYAADVAARRVPEVPGTRPVALAAFAAAATVTLAVLFGLHVFEVAGRSVVPLAGMMVGNSLSSVVLASRRTLEEVRDRRDEVEARLALGQDWQTASRPCVRAALRSALIPQIETTKATGLVFLPGAMVGLLLAGVSPQDAVMTQAVVMFLVLAAVAVTSTVVALGVVRRLFTPDQRLVPIERRPG
ncbi:MAG TPA: iron export ABC transporter permease subunit FetB [Candidatus Lustribacter sp.]|nr:iron export ABC transporter permease subunit FetB [Candidatus Lustribacter sp.]